MEKNQLREKPLIPGGYVIMSRDLAQNILKDLSPYARDLFWYLLQRANHQTNHICKRGELKTSYTEIIENTKWKVGYRTQRHSKNRVKSLLDQLRRASRITTRKTTRGLIITICDYNIYMDTNNYKISRQASHENPHKEIEKYPTDNSLLLPVKDKELLNVNNSNSKKHSKNKKSTAYKCSENCLGSVEQVNLFANKFNKKFGFAYDDKKADYVQAARVHKKYGCLTLIDLQSIFWELYDSDEAKDFLGKKNPSFSVFCSLINQLIPIYNKRMQK